MIPAQVAMYHKYNDLVREGDYYRIASYAQNHRYDCWQVVSGDQKQSLVTFVQVLNRVNFKSRRILLKGLDAEKRYRVVFENNESIAEQTYSGDTLMKAGLMVPNLWGDFKAHLISLAEV